MSQARSTPAPVSEQATDAAHLAPVSTNGESSSNISWCDETIDLLLGEMSRNYMRLLNSEDTMVRNRIWASVVEGIKSSVQREIGQSRSFDAGDFLSKIDTRRAQNKWQSLKDKYNSERRRVGATGVGGSHPDIEWRYYDQVGQILRDDPSIHPHITLESMDMGVTGAMRIARNEAQDTTATTAAENGSLDAPALARLGLGRGRRTVFDLGAVRNIFRELDEHMLSNTQRALESGVGMFEAAMERERVKRRAELEEFRRGVRQRCEEDRNEPREMARQHLQVMRQLLRNSNALLRSSGIVPENLPSDDEASRHNEQE